jgi:hypothetical protein
MHHDFKADPSAAAIVQPDTFSATAIARTLRPSARIPSAVRVQPPRIVVG